MICSKWQEKFNIFVFSQNFVISKYKRNENSDNLYCKTDLNKISLYFSCNFQYQALKLIKYTRSAD